MLETEQTRIKWDQRHADPARRPAAADVLLYNRHLLPARGRALDLACGLGGNALLLARAGFEVTAWDLSPVAIARLHREADAAGLHNLQAEVRDVQGEPPPRRSFEVITVSYFLHRPLMPDLIAALKTGGLLFYQTYTRVAVSDEGPPEQAYRLRDNELLRLCEPLAIRVYREENRLGDPARGWRDRAMLVAERTA